MWARTEEESLRTPQVQSWTTQARTLARVGTCQRTATYAGGQADEKEARRSLHGIPKFDGDAVYFFETTQKKGRVFARCFG